MITWWQAALITFVACAWLGRILGEIADHLIEIKRTLNKSAD